MDNALVTPSALTGQKAIVNYTVEIMEQMRQRLADFKSTLLRLQDQLRRLGPSA